MIRRIYEAKKIILGKYISLLICLMAMLLLQPMVQTQVGAYFLEGLFIVVLFAGLRAKEIKKRLLSFEAVLLAVSLFCSYWGVINDDTIFFLCGVSGRAVFLFLVTLTILMDIFRGGKVTADNLAGAVCVYLLIAIIWGHLFLLIEFMVPESFSFTQGQQRMELWISKEFYPFLYFSLVTMTTVGYGDMSPVTEEARALATMEALLGQIYLTIMVAGLVGMYLSYKQEKNR